jgi:hypothetical protein
VYAPSHIDTVLQKMRDTGRPVKLTATYVKKTWLLKNAQYSAVLQLLRDMEFLDASGSPTDLYAEYQNPDLAPRALARGMKNAYRRLFTAYPDACSLARETLDGYIKQQTGAEKDVLKKISATFRKLCSLADFSEEERAGVAEKPVKQPERPPSLAEPFIPISMNIQIILPSDVPEEQYDKIFSSLKRFLGK